jgi:hypothetical protein
MRKFTILALLFPVLFAMTVPVGSQTRPRRVNQLVNSSAPSNSEAGAQERPRATSATSERPAPIREGTRRESRWPGMLLSTGLAIGLGRIGHGGSCSPSRGTILSGPRLGF